PVVLPSKHVVDRSTITQHLLSDAKDPFTRQPMTIEDVVPDNELRGKIQAWRAEMIGAAKERAREEMERKAAEVAGDEMDTTEG
ncbi:hypothetical protein IMZ48_25305, partial [Candidatus Bathyarchaeota archaeon]|nr:hypothetical protein [Candidatus Bathyarchaeota archaeon]